MTTVLLEPWGFTAVLISVSLALSQALAYTAGLWTGGPSQTNASHGVHAYAPAVAGTH